ncbi:MAG: oligosaccharide flippase family protein, partial [Deltaproteobacteria bacterium]|nr:oligosaccharide flippase family protein [Deltaproteobacteria bacterium]
MNDSASTARRFFQADTLKYLPSIAVSALAGIVMLPVATRLFSPRSFGNYSIALSAFNFLQVIASAWLGSSILRFHTGAEINFETGRMNTTAFWLTGAGSVLMVGFFLAAVVYSRTGLEEELFYLLLIVSAQLFAFNLLMLPLQVLRAQRRIGMYNLLTISRTVLPLATGIAVCLTLGNRTAIWLVAGSAVSFVFLVPAGYGSCFRGENRLRFEGFDREWAR